MPAAPKTMLFLSGLSTLFIVGAGSAILGPAVPVYEQAFNLSTATSGLLVSTLWIGCLTGVLSMYFKGAQIEPRPPLALVVVGSVLMAVAPAFWVALLGALIFGIGYGAIAALFNARVLHAFGTRGASRIGMLNALYSLGAIIAPYGFTLMGASLQPVFWTMAGLSALTWVFSGSVGLTGLPKHAHGRGFKLHWPILALALLSIGIEASLGGLGPTALIRAGLTAAQAAQLLSLFFVAALGARIMLVLVAHRFADFGILVFALGWATLCALGAALISPVVFFAPLGVSAGLFFQGEYVTATRKMGEDPRVSPVILAVGLVGAILAPVFFAQFMDALGERGFFWLVAAVAGAATLYSALSYRAMMR
jgi:MFS family permease